MEYKINSLKTELMLKDKQIKILRDKYSLQNENNADKSYESLNNVEMFDDINNSYLNFEEDFNVTNNSNDSNIQNK